jgi:hypothetical protein
LINRSHTTLADRPYFLRIDLVLEKPTVPPWVLPFGEMPSGNPHPPDYQGFISAGGYKKIVSIKLQLSMMLGHLLFTTPPFFAKAVDRWVRQR